MEQCILRELKGQKPSEIKKLDLDECESTSIVGLTDEFKALENLSMGGIGLTSLENMPKLPKLKRLYVGVNEISGDLHHLLNCPNLKHLNLTQNKIKDIEELKVLGNLKKLKYLHLLFNDIFKDVKYHQMIRDKIFAMIPSLYSLDDITETNSPVSDDESDIESDEAEDDSKRDFDHNEKDYDDDDDDRKIGPNDHHANEEGEDYSYNDNNDDD